MVTDVSTEGTKIGADVALAEQEKRNKVTEELVLQGRFNEAMASVYKIYADTATNFGGTLSTTKNSDGLSLFSYVPPSDASGTLSYYQKEIAKQQAKGYVYNAWSNAVNASATTLGLLISENDAATATQTNLQDVMLTGVNSLIAATSLDIAATPKSF
jgi:hypothetical protein